MVYTEIEVELLQYSFSYTSFSCIVFDLLKECYNIMSKYDYYSLSCSDNKDLDTSNMEIRLVEDEYTIELRWLNIDSSFSFGFWTCSNFYKDNSKSLSLHETITIQTVLLRYSLKDYGIELDELEEYYTVKSIKDKEYLYYIRICTLYYMIRFLTMGYTMSYMKTKRR